MCSLLGHALESAASDPISTQSVPMTAELGQGHATHTYRDRGTLRHFILTLYGYTFTYLIIYSLVYHLWGASLFVVV